MIPRALSFLLSLVTALSGADPSAATQDGDPHDGHGLSRWGEIPARADSVVAPQRDVELPPWENAALVPYELGAVPFRMVNWGFGASLGYLERTGITTFIGRLLGPQALPYGFIVSPAFGGLPGPGLGIGFYHNSFLAPDNRFQVATKGSLRGDRRFLLGIEFSDRIEIGSGYRIRRNARYFGLGPTTSPSEQSFYTQELFWAGIGYKVPLGRSIRAEVRGLFSTVDSRGPGNPERNSPSIEERFSGRLPAGYGNRSDGFSLAFELLQDTTPNRRRPDRGGIRRLVAEQFEPTNVGESGFWTLRAELQQFVPLWFTHRTLALRGYYTRVARGSDRVNFQRLMTNDDPDLMRGYDDFRWRDEGMFVATAEYRWPVWANHDHDGAGVDAYLFSDFGQVFGDADQIALNNLTASYGVGIRVLGSTRYLFRLEVGFSDERTIFRFRTDQMFQFAKDGLFYGRTPVPAR